MCEWDKTLMGPIRDECGVEQGGVNSSEFYKVYNNGQLNLAQSSKFGIEIGPVTISSIGQADDVALVADDLHALQGLLDLSLYFCKKKHILLNTAKTKLQVFSSKKLDDLAYFCKKAKEVKIAENVIDFVEEAEHVGIVRSVKGNLPHLQSRITAHKKQLGSILPVGLAKGNRANPEAVLRAHQIYCLPVLLSGTAALVLKTSEVELLDQYLKETLVKLQKLSPRTPPCVTYFLAGHMPATAILHIRQLTLFGMVCHQKHSVLYNILLHQMYTAGLNSGSWVMKIRDLCIQYDLPPPISLLLQPLPKLHYKSLVKSSVLCYWQVKLRARAASLDSLRYFQPDYMSLVKPHPIWTSCNSNPYEVNKAIVQARMLSGRYPTDKMRRHWTQNKAGLCILQGCSGESLGSLEHLLLSCPALQPSRQISIHFLLSVAHEYPIVKDVVMDILCTTDTRLVMQFLLDCSALPTVISLVQMHGTQVLQRLFSATRNWCYSLHRKRMTILGLYQYR